MKKKIAILSALAVILCAGCTSENNNSSESSSVESSSNSSIETSSDVSTESSIVESSSSAESSSSESENSIQPSQDKFPEEFTGFVGETLYGKDAEQRDNLCYFDGFAYVRWATPVFDNTLKTPDLINWDTYEMPKYDHIIQQKDPKWFVVKPGDVLENGLVVKSAHCVFEGFEYDGKKYVRQTETEVEFENTLTLTGILYCQPEDGVYVTEGDMYFFADSTENSLIPVIDYDFGTSNNYFLDKWVSPELALVYDNSSFSVGNMNDVTVDLSGIIKKGGFSKVKVTLDNIKLIAVEYSATTGAYGDIVTIEKIS